MNDILAFVILTLMGICFIIYVILQENKMQNYVPSDTCLSPLGIFSVENGMTYSSTDDILETCYDGKTNCIFNSVATLTDAINICNTNNLCERFAYAPQSKIMTILSTKSKYTTNKMSDIYNRQILN